MCVCAGGHIWASGRLSTEKYDPAEDTWTEIPAMNFYSDDPHAEVMDDTIFVIAYYYKNQDDFLPHVACFDDKEKQWFVVFCDYSGLYNHRLLLSKSSRK
jgi:hypothetical protein